MITTSKMIGDERPVMLVFPFGLLAHYLRCIVLCREFKRHFRISFLYHPEYDSFVKQEGFETFHSQYLDPAKAIEGLQNFDLSWLKKEEVEQLFLAQVTAIRKTGAAVVLGDYSPTLKMAAEKTGVRFLSLMNGYMSKYYAGIRKISKSHPLYKFVHYFPNRLVTMLTRYGESLAFLKLHRPFCEVRQIHKLRSCASYLDELEGDINLVCDLPELFPQQFLPRGYRVIGPLYYDGPGSSADSNGTVAVSNTGNGSDSLNTYRFEDTGKKTILVTMGSSGDWSRVAFLNDRHFEQYTIIAVGDRSRALYNRHIIHLDFVAMHDIFPRVNLMICHGGNGTLYQGLYYGVPTLICTNHCEQEWNLEAFERLKLAQAIYNVNDQLQLRKVVAHWLEPHNCRQQSRLMHLMRSWEKKMPGLVHKLSESIVLSQAKSGIVSYS